MQNLDPKDTEALEADRVSSMRVRLVAIALLNTAIWLSQAILYESTIFPDRRYALPYRAAEFTLCAGLLWLAARKRPIREMELGATFLLSALLPVHGLALLVVHDSCVVPFLLTMEWSQIVVALAALLSFWPAVTLFAISWVVGVAVVSLRPGFDADLSDHVVLAIIYGVVLASIRSHDRLRVQDFLLRRELEAKNASLRAADESRSRLFVNLSHDLRTPLALIRGEAHALRANVSEEEQAGLARIERSARDVADLADQLLQAARLDAGRLEAEPAAVDLAALAGHVSAQFSGGVHPGKIRVNAASGSAEVVARVDPVHLRRIVFNLMSNATRQLREGATEVDITVFRDADGVGLDVKNDGPPVPEGQRAQIFERFAAFDREGGMRSGIGLPIARELAELNGGSLTLLPGEPTVFRLRLPATHEAPGAVPAFETAFDVPPAEAPSSSGTLIRTLLVVEDHDELRALLTRLLSARFRILAAPNVEAAKRLLDECRPAAVLSDLMLPDGRGHDVLEAVRERFGLAETPVVFLSAIADERERVAAFRAGASDYVVKPFDVDELVARLEAVCERGAERRRALDDQREEFLGELHDGVNAALARAALLLDSASDKDNHGEIVGHARSAVLDALAEARALIQLRQEHVVAWGNAVLELEEQIREAAAGFGVAIRFADETDGSIDCLVAAERHALCRLGVEAITNALRHAQPAALDVSVRAERGRAFLTVENETREKKVSSVRSTGFGLRAARRRLERLGGSLSVGPAPNGAWRVQAVLPAALSRLSPAA